MENHPFTNQLINESSPYLLQHAHNPVDWHPWGDKALEKAQNENKPIILSIGYAACHWCHVMAHESFEDIAVAEFMNENFIPIKVDREERPDVDLVYMNAVQLLTGHGGWPLNIIALPDGRPVYGGTYFPKERWLQVLTQVSEFIKRNPDQAEAQAKAVTNGVKSNDLIPDSNDKTEFTENDLRIIYKNWKTGFDLTNGGYTGAPKFPLPAGYQFLLQYNDLTGEKDALDAVTNTLNKMAYGGIYDQVGGGFARYSTDAFWRIPHFEKMLYDNAQLVTLYAFAYQKTKEPLYKNIVYETLQFTARELTSKEGAFFSSLDADSEGEEGRFYAWTKEELQKIPGIDGALVTEYFNVTDKGNWEKGNNILFRTNSDQEIAEKYKMTETELIGRVAEAKKSLLGIRSGRGRLETDDKILTGWNALMIKAYVDAYRIFGEQKFIEIALRNARFILQNMKVEDNRLHRSFKNEITSVNAFLDDYAFLIEAFISLYQATFNEDWLSEARNLTEYTLLHFFDPQSGMFFYTSDLDTALIVRKMEITDNVIPSSNSTMAKNLFLLGHFFYNDVYIEKSRRMVCQVLEDTYKGSAYYANWDLLITWFVNPPYEVAILGKDYASVLKEFGNHYLPNVLLSGGNIAGKLSLHENKLIQGQTTIYVCQNKTCKLPVTEVEEALQQLGKVF